MIIRSFRNIRLMIVWFALVAATALASLLGSDTGSNFASPKHASAIIITIAFIKVRFVISEFMEVRCAPRLMQVLADIWLVTICALLIWLYWHAQPGTAVG